MMASVAEVKDFSDPSATNMFGCCEYSNSPTRPNSQDNKSGDISEDDMFANQERMAKQRLEVTPFKTTSSNI